MYVTGAPTAELFSMQDHLLQAIWMRREQIRTFETLINVLASGISINPDITKEIDRLTQDYFELVLPGSKAAKKNSDRTFAERTNRALAEVASLLSQSGSGKMNTSKLKPL